METDEDFHVVFAYDGDHPTHDELYSDIPYQDTVGNTGLVRGDVSGRLVTMPRGGDSRLGDPDLFRFGFIFQQTHIAPHEGYEPSQAERLEALFDVVTAIYEASSPRPAFVYGLQFNMLEGMNMVGLAPPVDAASLADDRINYAVWVNVFSPRLVETYGRETLLSAPVWRAEELDDGAILLVYDDEPFYLASFTDLNEHLGLEDPGL